MLALVAVAVLFTGCKGGVKGALGGEELPKMDSEACIVKAKEGLAQLDLKKYKVIALSFGENGHDEMSNELGSITFRLLDLDGREYSQNYAYYEGENQWKFGELDPASIQREAYDFEKAHGIIEADLDAKKLVGYFEAAKKQIPKEYTYQGLSSIHMKYEIPSIVGTGKYGDKLEVSFDAMATENGKEKVESAGKTTNVFYEVSFELNDKGEIEMDK